MKTPELTKEQDERFDDGFQEVVRENEDGSYITRNYPDKLKQHLANEIALAVEEEHKRIETILSNFSDGKHWISSEFDKGVTHGINAMKKYILREL